MSGKSVSLVDIIADFETCDNLVTFLDARGVTDIRYSELYQAVKAQAAEYAAIGVVSGDRVVMALDSSQVSVVRFLALLLLGAVPVSIKPTIPYGDYREYVRQILRQQNARAYLGSQAGSLTVIDSDGCAESRSVEDLSQARNIAFVQYTSGSVAEPKPVPLSHEAVMHNIRGVNRKYGRSQGDCMLNVIPLCHDMGLVGGLLTSIVERHNLLIVDSKWFLRSPVSVLEFSRTRNVTTAPLPNFVVRYITRILRHTAKSKLPYFERWTSIYVGSEPIRREMVEDFISAGADFGLNPNALIFSYGMAEASLVVCSHRFQNMEHSFDATGGLWHANNGKSLDGIEVDLNGQSWGTYKEIRVRGKSLFEMPAASDQQTDGWYHTGDVGYLKNRDLYVVGRARDYVIVDGCNVHAADIEQVLCDAIGLAETVIQPVNGRLCVWLVTKRTDWSDFAEVKKILKKCFTVTNPFVDTIRPGHVVRNASGKIVKDLTVKRLMRKSCVMLAEL